MDNYDLRPLPKVKRKSPTWNILTVVVLVGVCGAVYYFYSLFMNPNSFLNPFPPVALPTAFRTATSTPTDLPGLSISTSKPGGDKFATRTKAPTWTPLPSETPKTVVIKPSGSETITPTPMPVTADFSYGASTSVHADSGCKWMGVGGKVVDAEGKPIAFQTVQLSGTLNGKAVNAIVLSGHDPLPAYGPSGFEFNLGTTPVDTTQTLWIMLFDNAGIPLTNKIFFDTFSDCKKNLVMVIFTKIR